MRNGRKMSFEERGRWYRQMDEILYGSPGKLKRRRLRLVCDDGQIVNDVLVNVSPFDPNWENWRHEDGKIAIWLK
jgi:hypothetical protein